MFRLQPRLAELHLSLFTSPHLCQAEDLIIEMAEEGGDQPWHSAVDISPPVKLPDMDSAKDDIPMFTKTPSQVRLCIAAPHHSIPNLPSSIDVHRNVTLPIRACH